MPQSPTDLLRDSIYVTVGFGLITVQKLQVQRRKLEKLLGIHLDDSVEQVTRFFGHD